MKEIAGESISEGGFWVCVGVMGWQVLYLNKLDLSKQHRDSSLSVGAGEN